MCNPTDKPEKKREVEETGSGVRRSKRIRTLTAEQTAAEQAADLLRQQIAVREANVPRKPTGTRGDTDFHLAFVRVGQGDCTIMSTPNGKVLMVDCGSTANPRNGDTAQKLIRSVMYQPRFLRNRAVIDSLFFTHSDADHYNKLHYAKRPGLSVGKIYHSADFRSYGGTGNPSSRLSALVADEDNDIVRVRLAERKDPATDDVTVEATLSGEDVEEGAAVGQADATTGAVLLYQETDPAVSTSPKPVILKVYALASEVLEDIDEPDAYEPNTGSLVLLIEIFGKKIVITGDATTTTEAFITRQYPATAALIDNVDVAHMAHHGSDTSSGAGWIGRVNPTIAVANAGKAIAQDRLPKKPPLDGFSGAGRIISYADEGTVDKRHDVYYWAGGTTSTRGIYRQAVYTTGSNGTHYVSVKKNRTTGAVTLEHGV